MKHGIGNYTKDELEDFGGCTIEAQDSGVTPCTATVRDAWAEIRAAVERHSRSGLWQDKFVRLEVAAQDLEEPFKAIPRRHALLDATVVIGITHISEEQFERMENEPDYEGGI